MAKRKALGLCVSCGKPKDSERVKCAECREKARVNFRNYYASHKEKFSKYCSDYHRKNFLYTVIEGKKVRLVVYKRDYPSDNCCELCSAQKRLVYHHWRIENKKAYGLWICGFCHKFAEIFDKKNELVKKYEELKKKIEFEFT